MKVSELPENTNLTEVKVKLPSEVLKDFKNYMGGEQEMYIIGFTMGDFFLSPQPKSIKERRLYPLPPHIEASNILDWEVVEVNNTKVK
jgi:hypothetical protein